jgi:hypothetical protein
MDAVVGNAFPSVMVLFGGFEQGLGRDAAHVQAGAAQRRIALEVDPLLHAGGFQPKLRAADRRHITGGTAADDDYIVSLGHADTLNGVLGERGGVQTLRTSRAGSSMHSLTVTRKVTASRPSMMR